MLVLVLSLLAGLALGLHWLTPWWLSGPREGVGAGGMAGWVSVVGVGGAWWQEIHDESASRALN